MDMKRNGAMLYNLRRIAVITILNILHVTANIEMAEKDKLIYILQWTWASEMPFRMERHNFVTPKCQFQNCFITQNVSYLNDVTNFDAILFDAVTLKEQPDIQLPTRRSLNQRYVLISADSSVHYPITPEYNNFFNFTWTYKLDSDVVNGQIVIRDVDGKIIGPKKEMHWLPESKMQPTDAKILSKLAHKNKAAIWLVTNCDPESQAQGYVKNLQEELRKYNQSIDLYGHCANNILCTKDYEKAYMKECEALIESKYMFYLSFENVLSEDYVSTQLLTGLNHYAVPVVFGGANHTRFMPDEIYLDALELGPVKLAKTMNDIIHHRMDYEDMFRWHRYYSYSDPRESPDSNTYCAFCAALNDKQRLNKTKVYKNIVKWFNERKDWNAVPIVSKLKRSAETKDQGKDNNVQTTFKPKPYVAINIKYPPRPTSAPRDVDDDSCSSILSCLKGTFKEVWNSLSIRW